MSTNCIKWPIFYFIERKSFSSATYAVFPPKHGPTVETGIYGGPEFSILFVCVFFLPRTGLKSVFEGTVMEVDDDSNLPRSVMKYELEDKERLCAVRLICQVSVCSPSDILPSRIPTLITGQRAFCSHDLHSGILGPCHSGYGPLCRIPLCRIPLCRVPVCRFFFFCVTVCRVSICRLRKFCACWLANRTYGCNDCS